MNTFENVHLKCTQGPPLQISNSKYATVLATRHK